MRENTDQNNSEYGHFLRSYALLASEYHRMKSLEYLKMKINENSVAKENCVYINSLFDNTM